MINEHLLLSCRLIWVKQTDFIVLTKNPKRYYYYYGMQEQSNNENCCIFDMRYLLDLSC